MREAVRRPSHDPLAPHFARAGATLTRPLWPRVPVAVLLAVVVLQCLVIAVALWSLPGQVERHRAVTGDRICGTDPAPCLEERSGTLGVSADQTWTVTDTTGVVWEIERYLDIPAGEQLTLLVYSDARGDASPVSLLHEGRQVALTDGYAPGITLAVAVVVVAVRTALVWGGRARRRYVAARAEGEGARVWWGMAPRPATGARRDVETTVWWGVALLAPLCALAGAAGVWTYWIVAPIGLALFHVGMSVVDDARAKKDTAIEPVQETKPESGTDSESVTFAPAVVWLAWAIVCVLGAVLCLAGIPGERERSRAVTEQRLCVDEAAPCLDEVVVDVVLAENDAESCGRGSCTHYDVWELTDPDGVAHVYDLDSDSEQWMASGSAEALAHRMPSEEWSVEYVRSRNGEWVRIGDAGPGTVAFLVGLAAFFARTAVGVARGLPDRVRAVRAVRGGRHAWWGWSRRADQPLPPVDPAAPWWAVTWAVAAVVMAMQLWWAVFPAAAGGYVVGRVLTQAVRHAASTG